MKLVQRADLNAQKWENWCLAAKDSQPFLHLQYLDATAENLVFVVNASETGGMALPYIQRLGIKTLYMPVFCRWLDWIGEDQPSRADLTAFLVREFPVADVYFRCELLDIESGNLIYQTLNTLDFQRNSQVKRKLKAIEKSKLILSTDCSSDTGIRLIKKELKGKFATLKSEDFDTLEHLVKNLTHMNQLFAVYLRADDRMEGVLFLVKSSDRILYLKGATTPEIKKMGGMYAMMNHAIDLAFQKKCNFDFGGSRIEGVRQFNKAFGGKDMIYYRYAWNNGPTWYSSLKKIRNLWKRK